MSNAVTRTASHFSRLPRILSRIALCAVPLALSLITTQAFAGTANAAWELPPGCSPISPVSELYLSLLVFSLLGSAASIVGNYIIWHQLYKPSGQSRIGYGLALAMVGGYLVFNGVCVNSFSTGWICT